VSVRVHLIWVWVGGCVLQLGCVRVYVCMHGASGLMCACNFGTGYAP
jgi:hypothetical protein